MDDPKGLIKLDYARAPKRMSHTQLAAITAAAGACLAAGAYALRPRAVQSVMLGGDVAPSQITWQQTQPSPTTEPTEAP